jgi:hypothetical protein
MSRHLFLCVPLIALVGLTACGGSPQQENGGWVGMTPYVNEESGLRGLMPQQGWSDEAQLVLGSAPVGLDELAAEVVRQTDLQELPPALGTYTGRAFTWNLYSFECHLPDFDPLLTVKLAQAEGESASYFVVLAALPQAYEANPSLYETVFRHAVYALEPLK